MAIDKIKLNLVNKSGEADGAQVVIFQKNEATGYGELAVAWRVIEKLGLNWIHPFTFPLSFKVGASDSYGNHVTPLAAEEGQLWTVKRDKSGDQLDLTGDSSIATEVQILNGLGQGSMDADIYKDDKRLATKHGVVPGSKASFSFKPKIYIGIVSQVVEGEVMDSAVVSNINTEIDLFGIASADIWWIGGGQGKTAGPYGFVLKNVERI